MKLNGWTIFGVFFGCGFPIVWWLGVNAFGGSLPFFPRVALAIVLGLTAVGLEFSLQQIEIEWLSILVAIAKDFAFRLGLGLVLLYFEHPIHAFVIASALTASSAVLDIMKGRPIGRIRPKQQEEPLPPMKRFEPKAKFDL